VRESSDKSVSGTAAGLGGGVGAAGARGEFLRSITDSKVLTAFSMIGST
jgi:hypothetical protein